MKNKVECSKCLGAKEVMTPKKTRGFEYKTCDLCNGQGKVEKDIADDYIISLNEDEYINELDG